jgi:3-methyladenine DNA glycosylase AlkD
MPKKEPVSIPPTLFVDVRKKLKQLASPETKESTGRYFKDAVKLIGVRAPDVRRVAKEIFLQLSGKPARERMAVAFTFLRSEYLEEKQIAVAILEKFSKTLPDDFLVKCKPVFENAVYDWATCDGLSGRVLRHLLKRSDVFKTQIMGWCHSKHLWLQRASAVAFVNEARHGKFNREILAVCGNIVRNPERFVQLGMGWVIRELFLADRNLALSFLSANYKQISREGLRYAIEKMPKALQKRVLDEHAREYKR